MEIQEKIVNRVAASGLVTIDPAVWYPEGERVVYDLKDNLFQGLILREKEFRAFLKEHDFSRYSGKLVAVTCSADAIIPTWAYMLLSVSLEPYAKRVVCGSREVLETLLFREALDQVDMEQFRDQKIVIKGCGDIPVPPSAYMELAARLKRVAKSVMYGEACSTVPVFKRKD